MTRADANLLISAVVMVTSYVRPMDHFVYVTMEPIGHMK